MNTVLAVVVLINVLLVLLWDAICLITGRDQDTVSEIMHEWSVRSPLCVLLVGVFIGHVFARLR